MATPPRSFARGQLQFITASTYRRAPLFRSARLAQAFVTQLQELRHEFAFRFYGWVLMPDHFHLLLKCEPDALTSRVIQQLKHRTAARIPKILRAHPRHAWCRRMLERLHLPDTVHDGSHCRVWQRRFYPFGVYSQKKLLEKLTYMHNNPVERGLVKSPGDWPWPSWRAYYLEDASALPIDPLP